MFLIVGLGNPGEKYQNTRHNLGFKVIDDLAARLKITKFKNRCNSFVAESRIQDHKVILAEPQTFMNNSGEAVTQLISWYKFNLDHLILIYDDVDLEVGQIRVRQGGSAGGHHGVESVLNHVKTGRFIRIRIGIGREEREVTEYVLQNIPKSQSEQLAIAISGAADAVLEIVQNGIDAAMNKFNGIPE